MKRYVEEFANDEMKEASDERKEEIKRILWACNGGLITSYEAICTICGKYKAIAEAAR